MSGFGYDYRKNTDFRRQAEQRVARQGAPGAVSDMSELEGLSLREVQSLVHDLRVHQVELEMQNEELRAAQLRLEISRDNYMVLYELSPVAYLTLDIGGRILAANLTAVKLFATEKKKLIGAALSRFAAPEKADYLYLYLQKAFKTQERQRCEMCFVSREGRKFHAHMETTLLKGDTGQACRLLTVLVDITEHKVLEEELLKADKLETISLLAGGIAHDFNNYLATLLGNISLLKIYKDNPQKILEKLKKLEEATFRAKELTYQLFTFATGGAPLKEKVSINEMVLDCLNFASSGTNVLLQTCLADDLQVVEVDKGQFSQVLNNIIINAIQAMPQGGTILVKTENITLGKGNKEALVPLPRGDYIRLSIADEGIGIQEEDLKKIFDPFYTTKARGRGLGLATSYSVIKNHKGYLDVTSKPGAGTTFYLYLPASRQPGLSVRKEKRLIPGTGKILVMDDEAAVRKTVGEMLINLGYEVHYAAEGRAAIEAYREALQSVPFDLVLLDLTVKGGLGGRDTLTELLKIDPAVQAVVSSGYSDDRVMTNFKEHGFKGVVKKPYTIEVLSAVIHQAMKAAQPGK